MDTVVITGCGWVTPFVSGRLHEVLNAGPGVEPPVGRPYWSISFDGRRAFDDVPAECRQDASATLAATAFQIARKDAQLHEGRNLPPPERVGLVLGCGLAGQSGMIDFANDVREQSVRFVSPIRFPQTVGNYVAGALARSFDIRGPNVTLANGIASGLDAVVEACALLRSGQADLVYAGGCERLTPTTAAGLFQEGVLLSDGACLFTLERESDAKRRGAAIHAKVFPALSHSVASPKADSPPAAQENTGFALTSAAGVREAGAVWVEHWVGRCLGALSAAAVAAGIFAAWGPPVPFLDPSDASRIGYGSLRLSKSAALLTVVAGDDRATTRLRFLVPWDPRK